MWISYLCFFFKQKTAYEMRISDWSSDVCSSDLLLANTIKNASAKGTNSGFTSAIKSIGAGAGGFLLEGGFGGFSGGGNEKISKIPITANDEIIVTATRAITRTPKGGTGLPTGAEIYNKSGLAVGGKLEQALGKKFFKGIEIGGASWRGKVCQSV